LAEKYFSPEFEGGGATASLTPRLLRLWVSLQTCRLAHLSVGLSVCPWVYCGKMADWNRMLFGLESGVGGGMGVLDGSGDRQRGRGSFGGKSGASDGNQWRLCGVVILCHEEWRCDSSQITLGFLVSVRFGTAQSLTLTLCGGYLSKHFTACDSSLCGLVVAT